MCEEKVNIAMLTSQQKVVVCVTVYDLYLFKICLFFLWHLNGIVIMYKASFLKHWKRRGKKNCRISGFRKSASMLSCVSLSVLRQSDTIK